MSAELYDRQMAWKKFISRRSDEQGRAILAETCGRRRPPHRQQDDAWREEKTRSNPHYLSNSSNTGSASSNGNKSNRSGNSGGSDDNNGRSLVAWPPTAALSRRYEAADRGWAQERPRSPQRRKLPCQVSPAPSYSDMLAARRTAEAAATTATTTREPSEVGEGKRGEPEKSGSAAAASPANRHSPKPTRPVSLSRQTASENVLLEAGGGSKSCADTVAAAGTAPPLGAAPAAGGPLDAAPPAGAVVPPAPPLPRRPVTPTASCARSDGGGGGGGGGGGDGDVKKRTKRDPTQGKNIGGRSGGRPPQQDKTLQDKTLFPPRDPEEDARGRRALGSFVAVSTASAPAAAAAAVVVAADGAEGNVTRSEDGNAGRGGRVVGKKTLSMDSGELVRKEQAWMRERAQLLTVIKLQHKQLLRSSEARIPSSPPTPSSKNNAAKGSGSGITSTAATVNASATCSRATTTPAEPDRPSRSSGSGGETRAPPPRWPSSSRPPRLHNLPAAAAAAPVKERVPPATPKTSMATATKDEDGSSIDDGNARDRAARTTPPTPPGCRRSDGVAADTRCFPPNSCNSGGAPNEQAFVFSTSERSGLLGRVELQREEAARARRLGSDGGRGTGETGVKGAFGTTAVATSLTIAAGRAPARIHAAGATGSAGSGSGPGTGSIDDAPSGRGGGRPSGRAGGGGRQGERADGMPGAPDFVKSETASDAATEVATAAGGAVGLEEEPPGAPSASCTEERLQAMERKIGAILQRLGDLERRSGREERRALGRRTAPRSNQGFVDCS